MRIGILGGTFDPFHRGHLEPVQAVRRTMGWTRNLYVPAWRQPFKADRSNVSGFHRFSMAVLATEGLPDVFVDPQELERGAISYTVETLEKLRAAAPQATLDWIIGDDNVAELGEWKNIGRIFELANFVVLARAGSTVTVPEPFRSRVAGASERGRCGSIVFVDNATVPVSSTEIRRRVHAGETIDELVDPRVSRYIHHYGLYREAQLDRFH